MKRLPVLLKTPGLITCATTANESFVLKVGKIALNKFKNTTGKYLRFPLSVKIKDTVCARVLT